MAKFTKKITNLINQQVPEFVLGDHPKFLEFVKAYYRFMESAEVTLANIELTDGIQLETETAQANNLVLNASKLDTDRTSLDAGDKILLEDTGYGKFQRGETITGSTSKATAEVLSEDLINNRIFTSAQDKFIKDELITGGTSGARATVTNYKPNPVNNIQDLLNFRDPDKAISTFFINIRNEPFICNTFIDKNGICKAKNYLKLTSNNLNIKKLAKYEKFLMINNITNNEIRNIDNDLNFFFNNNLSNYLKQIQKKNKNEYQFED